MSPFTSIGSVTLVNLPNLPNQKCAQTCQSVVFGRRTNLFLSDGACRLAARPSGAATASRFGPVE